MRTTFTYRLNEEKIRQQLRQASLPLKEEAWQRFSAYAEAHARPVAVKKLPTIKLNINRRMVLPAAAAVCLIVLTVILLNAVNVKRSPSKSVQTESAEPFVPMPQVTEAETIAPPPRSVPESNGLAQNTQAVESSKPSLVVEKTSQSPVSPPPAPQQRPAGTDLHGATTQTEVKKKTRVEAMELEPVQLPDIRPSLLSPEQEEDIRTN